LRVTIVTGFFLPVPAIRGGATERSWYGLAKALAAAGHEVTFISRSWLGLKPHESESGVRHIRLRGFSHSRHLIINLARDFIWGIRVARALPGSDIVVCNTVTLPAWIGRLRPSVGKVAAMIGRLPKGQVGFYRDVARIYVPSSFVYEELGAAWAKARARVIGYPIDCALLARSGARGAGVLHIGYVGRIHPEKGVALLIRAALLLAERPGMPDWKLTIAGPESVGDGGGGAEWVGLLKREAAALGQRVEWLGPEFDAERLAKIYGAMDIFCYPSLAEGGETFGVAVAEAMAAGCAVVVSRLRCFGDLVCDGESGLVFDHAAADPERLLADCMGRLAADPALRKKLADKGQQKTRRFDQPEVARHVIADLSLLAGAPPGNAQ
jgi:glycosyltransferase involved in cell wall biosynthesis